MDHFGAVALGLVLDGEEDLSSDQVLDQVLDQVFAVGRIAGVVVVWAAGGGNTS